MGGGLFHFVLALFFFALLVLFCCLIFISYFVLRESKREHKVGWDGQRRGSGRSWGKGKNMIKVFKIFFLELSSDSIIKYLHY